MSKFTSKSPSSFPVAAAAATASNCGSFRILLNESEQQQSNQLHTRHLATATSFLSAMQQNSCRGCGQAASCPQGVLASTFQLEMSVANQFAIFLQSSCQRCNFHQVHYWVGQLQNDGLFIRSVVLPGWRTGADAVYEKTASHRKGREIKQAVLTAFLTDRHSKGHALRDLIKFLADFGLSTSLPEGEKGFQHLMSAIDGRCATSFLTLCLKPFNHRAELSNTLQQTPVKLMQAIYELCLPFASSTKQLVFTKPVYLVQLLSWILKCTSMEQVWPVLCLNIRLLNQLFLASGIQLPSELRSTSLVEYVRCIFQYNQLLDEEVRSLLFPRDAIQPVDADSLPSIDSLSPSSPSSEFSNLVLTPQSVNTLLLGEEESPDTPMALLESEEVNSHYSLHIGALPLALGDEVGLTDMERVLLEDGHVPNATSASTSCISAIPVSPPSRKRPRSDATPHPQLNEERPSQRSKSSAEDEQVPALPLLPSPQLASGDDEDFAWPFPFESASSSSPLIPDPLSPFHPASPESSDMSDLDFGFPSWTRSDC